MFPVCGAEAARAMHEGRAARGNVRGRLHRRRVLRHRVASRRHRRLQTQPGTVTSYYTGSKTPVIFVALKLPVHCHAPDYSAQLQIQAFTPVLFSDL